jgi:uncharacterized protein YndB with AHSA1/START domain
MTLIDLTFSRLVAGPPGDVFDVWFDPARPGGPWHGADKALMNLAVDGTFYFGIDRSRLKAKSPQLADGPGLVGHFGRFLVVDRPRVVEHTWMSQHTHGIETTVFVTFEPRDGGTQLALVHRGIPDDELGRSHERGWTFLLARIAEHFEKTN